MRTTFFTTFGRFLLVLAFLALLGAWWIQLSGGNLLGMSQQHLFFDAIVLALLGIASLVDSTIHREARE